MGECVRSDLQWVRQPDIAKNLGTSTDNNMVSVQASNDLFASDGVPS